MDDKCWRFCAVGNIVPNHLDENGIMRYGTKAFAGGARIIIYGQRWNPGDKDLSVLGLNRFHRYAFELVPVELVENVRFQVIHKPKIIKILDSQEICEGWYWWKRTAEEKRACKEFVRKFNEYYQKQEINKP